MFRVFLLILLVTASLAQQTYTAATLPTNELLSEAGPTFRISDGEMAVQPSFIAYGDQRFTDPANKTATDPRVRQYLVDRIAAEKAAALVLNGDVPLARDVKNDYAVFQTETKPWRDAGLHVFPALGNHEFHGEPRQALENWWNCFPETRNRRWYSAQLGSRIVCAGARQRHLAAAGSDQARWIEKQITGLPASVDFVLITMHHPPVADIQTHIEVDHNPRPNELLFATIFRRQRKLPMRDSWSAPGHIHNYERNMVNDVVYLVSGGGGAKPYYVERTAPDLYQSVLIPQFPLCEADTDERPPRTAPCTASADPKPTSYRSNSKTVSIYL